MTDAEIRLECLKLAQAHNSYIATADLLKKAQEYFDYIQDGTIADPDVTAQFKKLLDKKPEPKYTLDERV